MGSSRAEKVSADDKSKVTLVENLRPFGRRLRMNKKSKRCLPKPLLPLYMGTTRADKVSADDKSKVTLVENLRPFGRKFRMSKKSKNCPGSLSKPLLPIYMGSSRADKVSADDKSKVTLVENLRPFGRKLM